MKKMMYSIGIILFLGTIGTFVFRTVNQNGANGQFTFGKITRGDLVNSVSSTGSISAVSTVEVGTQVSGIIDKLYVDFNDQVRKGQLLAVLDTVLLKTTLLDAQANMAKARAQLEQANADYSRNLPLFEKKLISEAEFLPLQIQLKTQKANLTSAEAALARADRNLKYAFIHSPIKGTVIQRNVEEGQTVAASLQAPILFIIAEDLAQMEIHAQVDESDIGQIKTGQKVTFSVQAYPDKIFEGAVRQIRLQPTTVQNVVNYTVVVDASNPENFLLPGMTATVDFIIEERRDVLLVPNTALRFQPSEKRLEIFRSQTPPPPAPGATNKEKPAEGKFAAGNASEKMPGAPPKDAVHVWLVDQNHQLKPVPLKSGLTDGKLTVVEMSRDLKEGMEVVTGSNQTDDTKKSTTTRQNFGPPRPF